MVARRGNPGYAEAVEKVAGGLQFAGPASLAEVAGYHHQVRSQGADRLLEGGGTALRLVTEMQIAQVDQSQAVAGRLSFMQMLVFSRTGYDRPAIVR